MATDPFLTQPLNPDPLVLYHQISFLGQIPDSTPISYAYHITEKHD